MSEQEIIPPEIAEVVLKIGEAEWGATDALTAEGHAEHVKRSVEWTAEHFGQEGPQRMNGLYIPGTEIVICHTGTSPNSADIARALAGAWNRLVGECREQALEACPARAALKANQP